MIYIGAANDSNKCKLYTSQLPVSSNHLSHGLDTQTNNHANSAHNLADSAHKESNSAHNRADSAHNRADPAHIDADSAHKRYNGHSPFPPSSTDPCIENYPRSRRLQPNKNHCYSMNNDNEKEVVSDVINPTQKHPHSAPSTLEHAPNNSTQQVLDGISTLVDRYWNGANSLKKNDQFKGLYKHICYMP